MPGAFREIALTDLPSALEAEYDLGAPIHVEDLGAPGHQTYKVLSPRGAFVLKPSWRPEDAVLFARVADVLNSRGIAQARLVATRSQSYLTTFGYFLSEFLEGTTELRPSHRQTVSTMKHLGAYLRVLAETDFDWRPDPSNFWTRVADVDYLLTALPRHLDDSPEHDRRALQAGLDYLGDRARLLDQLDKQLVHGDVAPDNVVTSDGEVVAIIDFTPFWEPALFGVACALYWFHVHGNAVLPLEEIAASLAACGGNRPWSREELALAPAMMLREALRRLATPLEAPAPMQVSRASLDARRLCLRLIVNALPALEEAAANATAGA